MQQVVTAERAQAELPVPRVISEGGRRGWTAALIGGAVLGGTGLILPTFLEDRHAFVFFAVFLGMIAGVYLGFALNDGRGASFRAEYLGLVIYGALAVLALTAEEPLLLAGGYIGHGIWDALHPHAVDTKMPWWYVPVCIGFDFVFGLYIFARYV
jgi:hypothetical protein